MYLCVWTIFEQEEDDLSDYDRLGASALQSRFERDGEGIFSPSAPVSSNRQGDCIRGDCIRGDCIRGDMLYLVS